MGNNIVKFTWNSNFRYRNIHGRHLLVDISEKDYFMEISPMLSELFECIGVTAFEDAYSKWCSRNPQISEQHGEEVIEMLENAKVVVKND